MTYLQNKFVSLYWTNNGSSKYCKKIGHVISECRSKPYHENTERRILVLTIQIMEGTVKIKKYISQETIIFWEIINNWEKFLNNCNRKQIWSKPRDKLNH